MRRESTRPTTGRPAAWVALGLLAAAVLLGAGGAAKPTTPSSFTVALLPDTQYYCDPTCGGTPDMYLAETNWLKDRAGPDNIRFVIHLGDVVDDADIRDQWLVADRCQGVLDGVVPYSVLPGNHDLGKEQNYYHEFFGPQRFKDKPWYGGHLGETNNNNYCYFEGAGMQFMVLSLQHNPGPDVLRWAGDVVKAHAKHRVIVASHEYLTRNGRQAVGENIWNNLVRKHDNIFMVVSGHVVGWAHQTSLNDAGGRVIEILSDYQFEPEGLTQPPLGGDGWLNTLEFVPEEDKIYYRSYSPWLDQRRTTALHEFTLVYEMDAPSHPETDCRVRRRILRSTRPGEWCRGRRLIRLSTGRRP